MILLCVFLLTVLFFFFRNVANQLCGVQLNRRKAIEQIFLDAVESDDRDELNYVLTHVKLAAILAEAAASGSVSSERIRKLRSTLETAQQLVRIVVL